MRIAQPANRLSGPLDGVAKALWCPKHQGGLRPFASGPESAVKGVSIRAGWYQASTRSTNSPEDVRQAAISAPPKPQPPSTVKV